MGEMQDQPPTKSRRRLLRISVRGLVVLVLVLGGGLGWIVHRARVQHDVVAAIQAAGGYALYDWIFKNGQPTTNVRAWSNPGQQRASTLPVQRPATWSPNSLERRIGVDYLHDVTYVYMPNSSSGAIMAGIGQLDRLETLMLAGSRVSDDELSHLSALTNLQALDLSGTGISDKGLNHLKGLKRLKSLSLVQTKVSDAGMLYLQSLSDLEELNLHRTKITDAGLVHLRGLRSLKKLNLQMTGITDAGLENLKGLTNLELVFLRNAKIVKNASLGALRDALPKVQIDY